MMPGKRTARNLSRENRQRPAPGVDYGFTPGEHEAEPRMVHAGPIPEVLHDTETKDPIVPAKAQLSGVSTSRPAPPLQAVTYQSRIRVMDAWQYAGSLRDAPGFVDRNWAGFDEAPVLRVPHYARPDGDPVICRVLDYVVRQEVRLADGMPSMERIEVWPREEFERLFIPQRVSGTAPPPPADQNLQELLDGIGAQAGEGPAEHSGEA